MTYAGVQEFQENSFDEHFDDWLQMFPKVVKKAVKDADHELENHTLRRHRIP